MIGGTTTKPNTVLCESCTNDSKPNELKIGRSFYTRNGFEPMIKYEKLRSAISQLHKKIRITICLQTLLQSLTLLEEHGIKQLTLICT